MKKIAIALTVMIFGACLLSAQTSTTPSGSGTSDDPYLIASLDNLYWLSQTSTAWSSSCIQTADIDATTTSAWDNGSGFLPISNGRAYFTGVYDGQGHTITGFTINRSSTDYTGLFSYLGTNGTVKNLRLTGSSVTGGSTVGGVVGENEGTITNCYNMGTVSGTTYIGGIAGLNYSTVTGCQNTGTVNGTNNVGGVTGVIDHGSISNSHNTGTVSGTGFVGGLAGTTASSSIINCYNTGSISGTSNYVGGVAGNNNGPLSDCYNTGNVNGIYFIGGVAGYNSSGNIGNIGNITNCHNTGTIGGTSSVGGIAGYNDRNCSISNSCNKGVISGMNTGGLVGRNYSATVVNCYNIGTINGTTQNIGGLVGNNQFGSNITNCYSSGTVSGTTNVGGAVGNNTAAINNSYWNTDIYATGNGYNNGGTNNITGKTTTEMQSADFVTLLNANRGVNFSWKVVSEGYPIFDTSINTGIENSIAGSLKLYPNPATDNIKVAGFEGPATVIISDISGRLLISKKITPNETVPVSTLPTGVYLISINSNNITKADKMIIQR